MEEKKGIRWKAFGGNWLVTSILCIVFGLVLIIWPNVIADAACYVLGGVLVVVGIVHLALFFWRHEVVPIASVNLIFGIILIVLGIVIIKNPEFVQALFPVIAGGIIVIHGVVDLKYSLNLSSGKYQYWWVALLFAILTILLGVLLIFNPFEALDLLFRIVGIVLLVDGATEFWIGYQLKRIVKMEALPGAEIIDVDVK